MEVAGASKDLVSRIVAGERAAEAELVERYSRGVRVIIRRMLGDPSLTDDLCQETLMLAIEKIRRGEVREPDKLSGYVASLARNLVIGETRRSTRLEPVQALEGAQAPGQLDRLLREEKALSVRRVLDELGRRDREVLFRFYIAEEDKERICSDLGLSSLHFNRVIYRARDRYRELYRKKAGQSDPRTHLNR